MTDAEKAAEAYMAKYCVPRADTPEGQLMKRDFLAGYAAAMQWRPIDSAPKDGTPVIARGPFMEPWVARYRLPNIGEPQADTHHAKEWRDSNGRWATPTEYLPLPPSEIKVGGHSHSGWLLDNCKTSE